ncbi:selenium-binding family protein [Gloeocapsopsis crepidinum]|uniref:selenium-binding family protein n=1 Tax=Gloeocapsopsis crepidinum TaxID=693223 RepID=UPI001D1347D9|nr:selenium-binding family protein [Gloeocapsopsis crepidinum]
MAELHEVRGSPVVVQWGLSDQSNQNHACCGSCYASPAEAMQAERDKLLYTIALYTGTGVDFGQEPVGSLRAHEMRYPGGDCTSDIWV